MSFYLTVFVISDNEATRHILKLASLPRVDVWVLDRLLPWLCSATGKMLMKVQKCSLPEKAEAFTTRSNCTIFWGKHPLPFSSGPGAGILTTGSQFLAVLSSWLLQGMKSRQGPCTGHGLGRTAGALETW